jgi:phage FluMu protein Com
MQTRCYRCGWSFAIKNEEIVAALHNLEAEGGVHYDVRCPRCRHINKLSIEQLRRAVPRTTAEETKDESPAPPADSDAG